MKNAIVFILALTLIGCSGKDLGKLIIGKWATSKDTLVFEKDYMYLNPHTRVQYKIYDDSISIYTANQWFTSESGFEGTDTFFMNDPLELSEPMIRVQ